MPFEGQGFPDFANQIQVYVTGIQYGRSNKKLPDPGPGGKISMERSVLIWGQDRES